MSPQPRSPALNKLIRDLGLAPHPEGGWYREIHRSPGQLLLERGARSALTVIDYVLEAGAFSSFHRVSSEEVWTWCSGLPVRLHLLGPPGDHGVFELGSDRSVDQQPLMVVPANLWQAAEPFGAAPDQPDYAWCSCIVSPGFDFADFELAERASLTAQYPQHAELIARLTR